VAIKAFRKVLEIDPKNAAAHIGLGNALHDLKQPEEAIKAFRKALEIDPKLAPAHYNLGNVLWHDLKRPQEALEAYREALEIDPKYADAHVNLGAVLCDDLNRPQEAIEAFRKALEIDPKLAPAHTNLGLVLLKQGRFAEARDATRHYLDLLPQNHPLRARLTRRLQQCEQFLSLEKKLSAVRAAKEQPANNAERLALASLGQQPYKRFYVTSARLLAEAFANNARLADNLEQHYRYNAACSAALAAAGQGEEARLLPDKVAFRLRGQTLDWLRADLAAYTKLAEGDDAAAKQMVRQRLMHWQQDADFVSVRAAEALAQLSEPERQVWRQLWADVAALHKKVTNAAPAPPERSPPSPR
jgi:eukaryotic-like serine/threonine-protein kinase